MKTRFLPTAVLAFALAVRAIAADPQYTSTISTSGSAEIHAVPDCADLLFSVGVRHADLAVARKEQAERSTKVLTALHAAGIEEKDLQTSQVNVSTHYVQGEHGDSAAISYYSVSQDVRCTLRNVKEIGEVTTNILLAGASGVGEATLRTSEMLKYRAEARVQAAHAAWEKAVALATELGVKVGKPYNITENADYDSGARGGGSGGEATQTTFAPGMINVGSTVHVTFFLE